VIVLLDWLLCGPWPPKVATGLRLNLLSRGPDPRPDENHGDNLYIMTILSNRKARIRHEEIQLENLGDRLRTVFSTRSEKLLLISVEGQVTVGEFVAFLDAARSVEGLNFALMTRNSVPLRQQPSLFMRGESIYTQYFFSDKHIEIRMLPGPRQKTRRSLSAK
jgi:biopolymer transport protein ExbD